MRAGNLFKGLEILNNYRKVKNDYVVIGDRGSESVLIQPTDEPDDGEFRRAYFLDPDDNEIEFVQRLV